MKRKITQQNSQMWRSLWLLLLVFMGGVYNPTIGQELNGKPVYISESFGKFSQFKNPKLSFKVLKVATDTDPGTVSVEPSSSNASFEGALTIPSVIYVTNANKKKYTYAVTKIPAYAFKGAGITDLLFTPDYSYSYQLTTIGNNAFEGAALTGTIQLPRTIETIGDNAFALPSGKTGTIADVVLEANGKDETSTLSFGKSVFGNRTITNLHVLGNFSYATYSDDDQTFKNDNVTNLMYYGDGNECYYQFLSTTLSKYRKFTLIGQNLYLPADDVKNFVDQCKEHDHTNWIPKTVNCLTFETTKDDNTYTLMLKSSDGPYELALHGATLKADIKDLKLDFSNWDIDILPTTSSLIGHVVQIDSKAFAGNGNLQSITITPNKSCKIEGNAFQGLPSLRYLNLSDKGITKADNYTLSRVPTTDPDESVAYQYTDGKYQYELSDKTPFGGLPAYTLVFLPTNIKSYPSATQPEEVYKIDGETPTDNKWTRPVDENYMLWNGDDNYWYCNNFGVYDVPELNPSTASGQKYSWYSWSTPKDFQAKNSTFYRDFKAGVPSSVCLPFAPDQKDATFYTLKSTDGSSVTLTSVDTPEANTPYFIRTTADTKLTSTKEQPIKSSATINNTTNTYGVLHGVYTGQSMDKFSNAYGVTATKSTTYPAGTFMKFGKSGYINPFRAYLTLGSSEAKILRLVISDTPTAIERTTLQEDNTTPYYNLQGMKTPHPTHGIYIHNGRKVIIK